MTTHIRKTGCLARTNKTRDYAPIVDTSNGYNLTRVQSIYSVGFRRETVALFAIPASPCFNAQATTPKIA